MKTITITNLKGGVGKTTTAINLAHRLASEDKRVLLLDTDHQANLSRFFNAQSERNIYQLFIGKTIPQPYAISDNLHIISSDMETATINFRLIGQMAWHSVLRNKLVSSGFTALYDYCIIDCPPALDMIVTNALTAADYVLIPLTSGQFAYDGLRNIIDRIDEIKESANPHIEILGILLTMVSERTRAVKTAKDMLKEQVWTSRPAKLVSVNARPSSRPNSSISQYSITTPNPTGPATWRHFSKKYARVLKNKERYEIRQHFQVIRRYCHGRYFPQKKNALCEKGHDRPRRATPNHPGQTPKDGRLPWMYAGRNLGSPGTPCR